ncbi:hypothetical protein V5O48_004545 [Marasmius crinis-equi]|uniref:Uncharacterized protein n=1 Tax=Marasmius crinis-equi TaxID=585013 RepID=A0ABR3FPR1_9AGAR
MASEPTKNTPTNNSPYAKAATGTGKRPPEDRSQSRASLLTSRSDGRSSQDIDNLDAKPKSHLGPGASLKNGPGYAPQVAAGTDKIIEHASRSDLDRWDTGGEKMVKPAANTEARGDSQAESLDRNEEDRPYINESPTLVDPKPTLEESWKTVIKEVVDIDDVQYKDWDDDINTLLVFVSLLLQLLVQTLTF